MGTEQSSQNAEFTDNDNPSKIINMRYKEIIDTEFDYIASNPVQTATTRADELQKVKKTVVGTCDFCGGTFTDLITHLRIHYYEKPFLCRACNMSFKTEEELEGHKSSCEEQKRSIFPCSVCMNASCTNPEHSRIIPIKPMQTLSPIMSQPATPVKPQSVPPVQTQTQTQTQSKLLSRTQTQLPLRTYTCFACKRSFGFHKQWKIHRNFCNSHSRFYKCPTCKKCFGLLIMSRLHQIHCKKALLDDYSCDYCSKMFDNKSDLVTHVLQKHKETIRITVDSLLEESKMLKKEADMLKKIQKPVITESILKKNLSTKKQ